MAEDPQPGPARDADPPPPRPLPPPDPDEVDLVLGAVTEGPPATRRRRWSEIEEDDLDAARPGEPDERRPSARPRQPEQPEGPPHPGFWWAVLWCVVMIIICQFIPGLAVALAVLAVEMIRAGSVDAGLNATGSLQTSQAYLIGAFASSQLALALFSWGALRLMGGKDWPRQVALRRPGVVHLLLAVVGVPALWLSAAGCYLIAKENLPGLAYLPAYFLTLVVVLATVGGYWAAVRLTTGRDWTKELARGALKTQLVLGTLGLLLVLGLAHLAYGVISPHVGKITFFEQTSAMEEVVKQVRYWPPALAVLIIGLGPGIAEELFCRAFLGRGLVGRHGVVMGVVLTSCFFGAIHVDPHQGTMAAIMGILLHFTYLTTRSLWVPMLLHFLNNSLSVIADKLPDLLREKLEPVDANPEAVPLGLIVASAFVVAAVGWALYDSRARLARVDGSEAPPWEPPYPGVAHPPEGSGTAVVYPLPGVLPTLAVLAGLAGFGAALFWPFR
jgi:membrane protease YdiL (CAAX protease family)